MTTPSVNAAGQFGSSTITVDPTPGVAAFSTITDAVNYANTLGGATVIVYPGTYNESVTWQPNISLSGSSGGTVVASSGLSSISPVVINGNQTYSGAGFLSFQNVSFTASSGNTWTIALPASSTIAFDSCSVVNSGGQAITASGASASSSVLNISSTAINGSTSGMSITNALQVHISLSSLVSGSGNSLNLATNADVFSNDNSYVSVSGNNVSLSDATAFYSSTLCSYSSPISCITFSANATAKTTFEIFDSSAGTGYYITTTGSFGILSIGDALISGSALLINPMLTTSYVPSSGGSGISWADVGASVSVISGSGSFSTAAITLTLPATPIQGSACDFIVDSAGVLTVAASPGQFIRIGNDLSVSGGIAQSSSQGDALSLVFRLSDSTWISQSVQGNWAIT